MTDTIVTTDAGEDIPMIVLPGGERVPLAERLAEPVDGTMIVYVNDVGVWRVILRSRYTG